MLMTDMRSIDRERAVKQREKKTEEKRSKKKDEKTEWAHPFGCVPVKSAKLSI